MPSKPNELPPESELISLAENSIRESILYLLAQIKLRKSKCSAEILVAVAIALCAELKKLVHSGEDGEIMRGLQSTLTAWPVLHMAGEKLLEPEVVRAVRHYRDHTGATTGVNFQAETNSMVPRIKLALDLWQAIHAGVLDDLVFPDWLWTKAQSLPTLTKSAAKVYADISVEILHWRFGNKWIARHIKMDDGTPAEGEQLMTEKALLSALKAKARSTMTPKFIAGILKKEIKSAFVTLAKE